MEVQYSTEELLGEQASGRKYLAGESYGEHFLSVLSASTHEPEGTALPFLSEAWVRGMAVPMPTTHSHSECHILRAFSAPCR